MIKFFKILTFNYLTSFLLESFDFYFDIFCLSFKSATLFLKGLYFNLSVEFSVFVCIILIIVGFYFDILSFFSFENVLLLSLNQSPSVKWKEGGNIILCKLKTLLGYFKLVFPFLILIIPVYCFFVSSHNSVVLCQEDTDYGATFYVFIYGFQWGWKVTITQVSSLSELYRLTVQLLISDRGNIIGTDRHKFLDVYIKGDSKNLHIPLPSRSSIKVITTSEDVNHSVGSAELGLKIDLFQDRLIIQDLCIYSDSGKEFKFDCFEYCGERHTTMWSIFTTLEEVELALSKKGFKKF
uniref:cytochrome c oxidase subunit II n=1 Tax=Thelohanellus kitauei TaxID=669202 RepID=UPI0030032588